MVQDIYIYVLLIMAERVLCFEACDGRRKATDSDLMDKRVYDPFLLNHAKFCETRNQVHDLVSRSKCFFN